MNISEKEIIKLRDMLNTYEEEHGTSAGDITDSVNCTSCAGYCSGSCNNFCTSSCSTYCDGNSGACWQVGHR